MNVWARFPCLLKPFHFAFKNVHWGPINVRVPWTALFLKGRKGGKLEIGFAPEWVFAH